MGKKENKEGKHQESLWVPFSLVYLKKKNLASQTSWIPVKAPCCWRLASKMGVYWWKGPLIWDFLEVVGIESYPLWITLTTLKRIHFSYFCSWKQRLCVHCQMIKRDLLNYIVTAIEIKILWTCYIYDVIIEYYIFIYVYT